MSNCALLSSALTQNDNSLYMCNSEYMRNEQTEQILDVLQKMMEAIGVDTKSELAIRAGLAHTTLTRIDANNPKPKSLPSWKTWIALSKATGVPVTFLGDKIISGSQQPSQSYVPQDPLEIKFRNFIRLLGPNERKLVISVLDTLADKMVMGRD